MNWFTASAASLIITANLTKTPRVKAAALRISTNDQATAELNQINDLRFKQLHGRLTFKRVDYRYREYRWDAEMSAIVQSGTPGPRKHCHSVQRILETNELQNVRQKDNTRQGMRRAC